MPWTLRHQYPGADYHLMARGDAGNLLQRADDLKGTVENFGYDGLNRLRSAGSRTFDYDVKGNLKKKGADTLVYGGAVPTPSHPP